MMTAAVHMHANEAHVHSSFGTMYYRHVNPSAVNTITQNTAEMLRLPAVIAAHTSQMTKAGSVTPSSSFHALLVIRPSASSAANAAFMQPRYFST